MTRRALTHAADLARQGCTDPEAPTRASAAIDVAAPAETVYRVLADLTCWPDILPGVTRMSVDAPEDVREGTGFSWRNEGFPLRSTIQRARPGKELTWTGQVLWVVAVHRNVIETTGSGCRLTSSESMSGWGVARLMPSAQLETQLRGFAQAIADEARRRA